MRKLYTCTALLLVAACDCQGEDGLAQLRPDLVVEPAALSFAGAFVGSEELRPLTLENKGSADLDVSKLELEAGSAPGLSVGGAGFLLRPAEKRTLIVSWTPQQMGPASGAVLIHSNDPDEALVRVPITGDGVRRPGPSASVCAESSNLGFLRRCDKPLTVDFGMVPTGSTKRATLYLKSVGDAALEVSDAGVTSSSHPDFVFTPPFFSGTLAVDAEVSFEVALTPSSDGELRASLQVLSNDPANPMLIVELVAHGVRSGLCAEPAVLDFGSAQLAQATTRTLDLVNCGQTPLTLQTVVIESGAEFAVDTPLSSAVTLQPSERHTVTLSYTPTDRGSDQGRARADALEGTVSITLLGHTDVCDLAVNPTSVAFGAVGSGQRRTRDVLVENTGGADCHVSALTLAGSSDFSVDSPANPTFTVAPAASATVRVAYEPSGSGSDTGTLTVVSDDPAAPMVPITLDGRQLAPGECALTAVPDPIAFGLVPLGTRPTLGVMVTNSGPSFCTVYQIALTAGSDPAFYSSGGPAIPLVASGNSFQVDISFAPMLTGAHQATLEIRTSLTGPPTTVQITGTGSGPRLCINPNQVVFGTAVLGSTTNRFTTLASCGSDPLQVSQLSLPAPTSSEFSIVSGPSVPFTLPAGSSMVVDLRHTSTNPGRDDGILRVASNDAVEPIQDVALIAAAGSACGDIVGRVCGVDGAGPAPGATVYVDTPSGRVSATSDAQGDYVLTCVPPGTVTVHAELGSWSTTFSAQVVNQQITTISGMNCLDPTSAKVAVVWGEWDSMETILGRLNVPYDYFDQNGQNALFADPGLMGTYDIIFLNCGFNEGQVLSGAGLTNLRNFVAGGGSVYASDWAYDAVEVGWPMYVDFYRDDTLIGDAQTAGNFNGLVDVMDATMRSALSGRAQIGISSCCTAIDSVPAGTTSYLEGDRLNDGGRHPFFVGFVPGAGAGTVMYTDFHNTGQTDIEIVFRWLINKL